MRVLVSGGAGYIGSTLVSMLLEKGYKVRCLDRFFFGRESIKEVVGNPNLEIIRDDIRWFEPSNLKNVDAVMDLAALSNDPSGELDPSKTYDINYLGRVRVAKLSKEYGVRRYILASSCSIYGFREDIVLDEKSPVNPLTTYAKCNHLAEDDVLQLADSNFTVTALRQATVYGMSQRMRFDIAINGMVLGIYKNKKIPVMRDGDQWRPFVHVKDTSRAFILIMESEKEKVNREIFNVGSNEQNYQILPLAKSLEKTLSVPIEIEWYGSPDKRSYRVSFDKIYKVLEYKTEYTPKEGAKEIYDALREGKITDSIKTKTVDWYKYLLNIDAIVKDVKIKDTIL
jgi:nucleoside-diphosphate-sugar epimerase